MKMKLKKLAYESVVEINGVVRPRPDGQENKVYISYKMGSNKSISTPYILMAMFPTKAF
jgi:aspartyl-tRNA synthetase